MFASSTSLLAASRARVTVAITALLGALAGVAHAQALPAARDDAVLPQTQAAVVDDGPALLVNPAGRGFGSGVELGGGWATRGATSGSQLALRHDGDGYVVFGGGFSVAAGAGVRLLDTGATLWRGALASALRFDETMSIGAALHTEQTSVPGVDDTFWDVGFQLRPARWLSLGAVAESLGATSNAAALRGGLSLRPFGEAFTVGVDVRAVPGPSTDTATAWATSTWTPGLAARLQWGGLGLFAGVAVQNLQASAPGPVAIAANGGVQVDLDHLGVAAFGGADGSSSTGGIRARMSTTSWASVLPMSGRWLQLELGADGAPVQRHTTIVDELFGDAPTATAVLAALDDAADDPSVEGLVLQLSGLGIGWGRAGEVRAALVRLRSHGKKVVVHFDVADDVGMFVASAADRVWMSPSGSLAVDGVRAEMVYVGEALHRLGFAAEAVAAGRYKSAPRAFTHDAPSPEELEVENALLDGVYDALVGGIVQGRGLKPEDVKSAIDLGGLSPNEAVAQHFVDGLVYADELPAKVAELAGRPGQRMLLEGRFLDAEKKTTRWESPPQIAFIPIQGDIKMGSSRGGLFGGGGAGSDDVVEAIREAADDDAVKAIVLRIDSPGGDALASDVMWRAVMLARDKKPVIASMGDVAASGGYYVASAAHDVFAEKTTITGSIGVFGLMFNAEKFAADNGVRSVELKRGALPGPTLLRPMTEAERARMQASVDATYERFLDAVVAGRTEKRIKKDELRAIAEGHVWTGAQALERKLVDREGSLIDALKLARERAGIAADDDVALRVITGTEGELPGMGGVRVVARALATSLGLDEQSAAARAVALLVGDPDAVALAVDGDGRPLALGPGFRVR
jgi:protease-4